MLCSLLALQKIGHYCSIISSIILFFQQHLIFNRYTGTIHLDPKQKSFKQLIQPERLILRVFIYYSKLYYSKL